MLRGWVWVKGIVHPKMKNSVIIYSPSSSSKPVWIYLFCWTQRKIFWRMWETEQFWGTIDFHSIFFFSYYGSQWCPKTAWLQTFFKISSFVFGRTKKFIQVWNYLRVSKWWQNFNFWVNYPFKESDGLGEETPPKSLSFCHQAAEALTRWQQSEKTVTGVIWVLGDFDSSASAAFEVDVLQRGESRPWDALS